MSDGFNVFKDEFLLYVSSLKLEENKIISFGNLDYDFDLCFVNGEYILSIYNVALDHYGMPYRNTLQSQTFSVSYLF